MFHYLKPSHIRDVALCSLFGLVLQKLALKCIRELRMRKGYKEDGNLVCRICKNKAFTATATLMYHYRSHAGMVLHLAVTL